MKKQIIPIFSHQPDDDKPAKELTDISIVHLSQFGNPNVDTELQFLVAYYNQRNETKRNTAKRNMKK